MTPLLRWTAFAIVLLLVLVLSSTLLAAGYFHIAGDFATQQRCLDVAGAAAYIVVMATVAFLLYIRG